MKEYYIEDDGIRLHLKLDMPPGYTEGEKCPLAIVIHGLTVHGDEDEAIDVKYAWEAAAKYADAKLVVIPGDDHCYHRHLDQVTAAIREFMLSVM